jgi:hypothetical protein
MACSVLIVTCYSRLGDQPLLDRYFERMRDDFSYYGGLLDYIFWVSGDSATELQSFVLLAKELGTSVDWSDVPIQNLHPSSDYPQAGY